MSEVRWFSLGSLGLALLIGLFIAWTPQFVRRGLLFGVYVGEEAAGGEQAAAIRRSWFRGMAAIIGSAFAICLVLTFTADPRFPWGILALPIILLGQLFCYLRAYWASRRIAAIAPPAAVAALVPDPAPSSLLFQRIALAIGLVSGLIAMVHASLFYNDLPERVPTHFAFSGKPDAWAPRSVGNVFVLPVMALIIGAGLGLLALYMARAKRSLRRNDRGVSLQAQLRFRSAISLFIAGMGILVTVMLAGLSIGSIEVGLGRSAQLPLWTTILSVLMLLFALGGSLFLAFRYGQGGSRLERSADIHPLTNGLADNRNWILGSIYYNREDPAFFVEKRFGLGYTINFGNWRAVFLLIAIFLVLLGMTAVAIISSH